MLFRQLFDSASSTYTYVLADERTRDAVVIDPVFERHRRDLALLRELELRPAYVIDTHCHADHVTGAWLLKQTQGARIALAAEYHAENVDVPLRDGEVLRFGDEAVEVRATPGHTAGCLSLVVAERGLVFTGDALLVRGAGRTDFQSGDAKALYRSIRDRLFTLPDRTLVYPAHDYEGRTVSTIGEEKRFNPRIGGGAREEDFVGYMTNLGLPHPKLLDVALPANLRSGMPESGAVSVPSRLWPVVTTYAGIEEIDPDWVASHGAEVTVLDVRSAGEFDGELGHLDGARLLPLPELRARIGEVPRDKPVVVVCQTGKRSAMATVILRGAGIANVANLAGGMAHYRELGL
ncbi:MAG TPA: MBL fold metallo-hydrolase [Polyangiaceae bacterium]|nr:MBL fold metallo-hydrolase [Polyangiaceae bacterium]